MSATAHPEPTTRRPHLDRLAIALLVICCAFWGLQQILIKATVPAIPPMWQAGVRFTIASALLLAWCRWRGIRLFERDGTGLSGLLAGALFAGEFICIYLGVQHTSASRLTVFLYTSPFVVALLLPRFVPSERLRPIQWAGLLIAFASVAVAFSEGFSASGGPATWRGDAMGLAAGVLWGLTTLTLRTTAVARASAEKTLFYQVATGAALALMVSRALGEPWGFDYPAWAWGSLLAQSVLGAFATYLTWMWMLSRYPATQMSSFVFLTPVFALLFGVGLLDEPLTAQLLVALAGVAAGIVLVSRR